MTCAVCNPWKIAIKKKLQDRDSNQRSSVFQTDFHHWAIKETNFESGEFFLNFVVRVHKNYNHNQTFVTVVSSKPDPTLNSNFQSTFYISFVWNNQDALSGVIFSMFYCSWFSRFPLRANTTVPNYHITHSRSPIRRAFKNVELTDMSEYGTRFRNWIVHAQKTFRKDLCGSRQRWADFT